MVGIIAETTIIKTVEIKASKIESCAVTRIAFVNGADLRGHIFMFVIGNWDCTLGLAASLDQYIISYA